jgi:hypothetical protein
MLLVNVSEENTYIGEYTYVEENTFYIGMMEILLVNVSDMAAVNVKSRDAQVFIYIYICSLTTHIQYLYGLLLT